MSVRAMASGVSSARPLSAACLHVLFVIAVAGCGPGEIDASQIYDGSILDKRPATLRDSREPVSGTVVRHAQDGLLLSEVDYQDGFPNGRLREWYPNGQIKVDRVVKFVDRGQTGGLQMVGDNRTWCENGTLSNDLPHDSAGQPRGAHRTWNCNGQLLAEAEHPDGPFRRWQELTDGSVILAEEGARKGGQLDGTHKLYSASGELTREENWRDGVQHGEFRQYYPGGRLGESGRFDNGAKVGTWIQAPGGSKTLQLWDYDPAAFNDQQYVGAFMQAAGIDARSGRLPVALRDFQVAPDKIRYYVQEGLIDPHKKLNIDVNTPRQVFASRIWTYPYVVASRDALPVLAELGADPAALDSNRRSRLHYCIASLGTGGCTADDVSALLALGLSATQADVSGNTPLHLLMNHNRVQDQNGRPGQMRRSRLADLQPLMRQLMDAGADPDARNYDGNNVAMQALTAGMFDVAGALLDACRQPGQTDERGLNVIHRAFMMPGGYQFALDLTDERRALVETAVARGVDPLAPMGEGPSLAQLAEQNGAIELAQYLKHLKP